MRAMTLVAALALAGCSGSPEQQPAPPRQAEAQLPSSDATGPAPRPVDTLSGEWRVAGLDGEVLNEPYGIALSADTREIWWEPRCAHLVRSYRISGDVIAIGPPVPLSSTSPVPDGTPGPAPVVCTIGLPPRLTQLVSALDAATRVRRTPENGIELSGGGHSLTLFSQ